jgi:hypothetical protein
MNQFARGSHWNTAQATFHPLDYAQNEVAAIFKNKFTSFFVSWVVQLHGWFLMLQVYI